MPHRPIDTVRLRLVPGPTAPRLARTAVRRALSGLDADVVERAMLLTSELVTNGVLHAATPLTLTLRAEGDALRVEVEDRDRTLPAPVPEEQSGPHGGFGLHIVERMAANWGCAPLDNGKTVWFEMPLRGERAAVTAGGRVVHRR
jgi:anti-sigma regulatory factor (Ser/Thr protein kinase)